MVHGEIETYYKDSIFNIFGGFTPNAKSDFKSLTIRLCNKQVQFLKALGIVFQKLFINQETLNGATIVALTHSYTTGTLFRDSFVDWFYHCTNLTYNYTSINLS